MCGRLARGPQADVLACRARLRRLVRLMRPCRFPVRHMRLDMLGANSGLMTRFGVRGFGRARFGRLGFRMRSYRSRRLLRISIRRRDHFNAPRSDTRCFHRRKYTVLRWRLHLLQCSHNSISYQEVRESSGSETAQQPIRKSVVLHPALRERYLLQNNLPSGRYCVLEAV